MADTLRPAEYRCETHPDHILTDVVVAALQPRRPVISLGFRKVLTRKKKWKAFAVVVNCNATGKAHEVVASGEHFV